MTEAAISRIEEKLDSIVRLLASIFAESTGLEDKSKYDKIQKLSGLGLDRILIAEILGTTPGTVSVALSQAKNRKKKKAKKETIPE